MEGISHNLYYCSKMHLPDNSSIEALGSTFSSFFIHKISIIHSSFLSDSYSSALNPNDTREVLNKLTSVTADEVRRLVVMLAPSTSPDLDTYQISSRLYGHHNRCNNINDQPITL